MEYCGKWQGKGASQGGQHLDEILGAGKKQHMQGLGALEEHCIDRKGFSLNVWSGTFRIAFLEELEIDGLLTSQILEWMFLSPTTTVLYIYRASYWSPTIWGSFCLTQCFSKTLPLPHPCIPSDSYFSQWFGKHCCGWYGQCTRDTNCVLLT